LKEIYDGKDNNKWNKNRFIDRIIEQHLQEFENRVEEVRISI